MNLPPDEPIDPHADRDKINAYLRGEVEWETLNSPEQAQVFDLHHRVTVPLEALKQRLAEQIVAEGGEFAKCANCGDTYPLNTPTDEPGEYWTDTTVCGPRCFDAYVAYLNNPEL